MRAVLYKYNTTSSDTTPTLRLMSFIGGPNAVDAENIDGGEIDVEHISPRFYSATGIGTRSRGIELTSGPDVYTGVIPNHTFIMEVVENKYKTVFEVSKATLIPENYKKMLMDVENYQDEELAEIESVVSISLTDEKQRKGFLLYLKNVIDMLEKPNK